jgi:hypothetical protein
MIYNYHMINKIKLLMDKIDNVQEYMGKVSEG